MKISADENGSLLVEATAEDATEQSINGYIETMFRLADDLRARGWGPEVRAQEAGRMRSEVQTTLELISLHADQARRRIKLADGKQDPATVQ